MLRAFQSQCCFLRERFRSDENLGDKDERLREIGSLVILIVGDREVPLIRKRQINRHLHSDARPEHSTIQDRRDQRAAKPAFRDQATNFPRESCTRNSDVVDE